MTTINSYLTFNGNCREAMDFYKNCLGGQLVVQTIGESPLADNMPVQMKECILHATLTNGNLVLMATDMVGEQGLQKGNGVSIAINCSSDEEVRLIMKNLLKAAAKTIYRKILFGERFLSTLLINIVTTGYCNMIKMQNIKNRILHHVKKYDHCKEHR